MKSIFVGALDLLFLPLTVLTALWAKFLAAAGIQRAFLARGIFRLLGVMPVNDHYYQPLINPHRHLKHSLRKDRNLPGVAFNDAHQLALLGQFHYNEELLAFPREQQPGQVVYYYNNYSFCSGDAEYLYSMVRHHKPKKIIEIGSGFSTLMIINALSKNRIEDPGSDIVHICIEPFEQPWLEKLPAQIIRKKVEDLEPALFQSLGANDFLFIDSSHMIRPQGDVLFEFLEILPTLASGVIVHVHDIFSPKDYLDEWIFDEHKLWNEQYLLEAFLSLNDRYEVLGALNYLSHKHPAEFASKCPVFAMEPGREPGSFWIRKK